MEPDLWSIIESQGKDCNKKYCFSLILHWQFKNQKEALISDKPNTPDMCICVAN